MRGDRKMFMLQAVDVSYSILYDHAKAKQEVQEMTNACVSHELRNPLNSICAMAALIKDYLM